MNTTLSKLIPLILLVGICLAACGQGSTEAKSEQARILEPQVPAGELQALVSGNNTFALDLYQMLRPADGNLLYSPYSISLALAMTYGGAREETEAQMAQTLHFDLPQAALHAAFNQLDLALEEKSEEDEDGNQPIQLDIANAIWGKQDHPFLPEYLDLLALNYGAGIHLSDFATQAEKTAEEINLWVSDQTHERIQDIIRPNSLGEATRLILVNAIDCNAGWNTHLIQSIPMMRHLPCWMGARTRWI
ncbi:MAG TPA: serpin family protein [Anaerolineales bacterium]|nr:serpin family protein [Anaerolineales bacterium]